MSCGEAASPGAQPRSAQLVIAFVVAAALGLLGCRVTLRFD
jgi:hypothetical protein